jgi:hypothetical protein
MRSVLDCSETEEIWQTDISCSLSQTSSQGPCSLFLQKQCKHDRHITTDCAENMKIVVLRVVMPHNHMGQCRLTFVRWWVWIPTRTPPIFSVLPGKSWDSTSISPQTFHKNLYPIHHPAIRGFYYLPTPFGCTRPLGLLSFQQKGVPESEK